MLQNRTPTGQEKTIQFANAAATTAKLPCVVNALAFIPINSVDVSVLNAYYFYAQISDAPKATGQVWSVGSLLYWDDTAKNFTTTVGTNTKCGHALAAALSADVVSGLIDFDTFA
jgi:predicted RecA/RadA family phage recombinase